MTLSRTRAIIYGGLTVGALDALDAIVLPSAFPVLANGILIHIFGVGLPSALFARAALPHFGGHMTRAALGLLVLGLAGSAVPVSAQSQGGACTYDACALRLRHAFWSGVTLVQGQEARRLARVGFFAPRVDVLATAPDSAKAHYLAFRTHQNRGGAFTLLGIVAAGAVGGLAYDNRYQDHEAIFWSLIGAGLTFSIIGGVNLTAANDHLQRSIWFYNRDLARP